ncbi:uncharacterized protein LOC126778321 [Nymphalis io]|uniref:uncharacterized protein LOC126778321 n=1 Tax=Inachis io TaxID=171585 RepID=UPI002168FD34|nr:uncharacterized protein LOC126778321 [Nymphalis io]
MSKFNNEDIVIEKFIFIKYFLLFIIFEISIQEEQSNDEYPQIDPQHMTFDFTVNKTKLELDMEECMAEYTECLGIDKKRPLCAENNKGDHSLFHSLCEMEYENCRNTKNKWRYIKDDC